MRWEPNRSVAAAAPIPAGEALSRGLRGRCPCCGEGRLFQGYLKLVPECSHCHAPLGEIRADDAPPYFTIFVTGHLLVPLLLWVEKAYEPPIWVHMVIWLPLFTIACIALLRPIKGAVVGWMLRLGLNGTEHGPNPVPAVVPRRAAGSTDA